MKEIDWFGENKFLAYDLKHNAELSTPFSWLFWKLYSRLINVANKRDSVHMFKVVATHQWVPVCPLQSQFEIFSRATAPLTHADPEQVGYKCFWRISFHEKS